MMKLDQSLSALFSEQKKKIQAKRDEKTNFQKERALVRDFKIKVTDLQGSINYASAAWWKFTKK